MVFWTLRLCIPLLLSWDFGVRPCMHTATSSWTFGSHPHSHSVEHLLEHLHPLFSLFCHSCSHWVASGTLACCWLCSCFVGPWVPTPGCFIMGSRVPIPGCFTFFTAIWRVFHSTKSNNFNANFSFGITAAVHSMEPAQFLTSRASRTHRPLVTIEVAIFHAQLESFITLSMYLFFCTCSLASFTMSSQRRVQRHVLPPRK